MDRLLGATSKREVIIERDGRWHFLPAKSKRIVTLINLPNLDNRFFHADKKPFLNVEAFMYIFEHIVVS